MSYWLQLYKRITLNLKLIQELTNKALWSIFIFWTTMRSQPLMGIWGILSPRRDWAPFLISNSFHRKRDHPFLPYRSVNMHVLRWIPETHLCLDCQLQKGEDNRRSRRWRVMFSATSYKALSRKATRRDMAIGGYRVKFDPYDLSTVK